MKRFFTFALSLLLPALLVAQNKALLMPNGNLVERSNEVLPAKYSILNSSYEVNKMVPYDNSLEGMSGTIDTLRNGPISGNPPWNSNFGFFGQDVMLQWFVAPADMNINGVGFVTSDNAGDAVSVKIVKVNLTADQITGITPALQLGYYNAAGNGFNDMEPFIDNDHDATVSGWEDLTGGTVPEPFGNDIWSDGGYGAQVSVPTTGAEYWVPMSLLGEVPSVLAGEVFGVVVKNDYTTFNDFRAGLLASGTLDGYPAFKFYANGRTDGDLATAGWWAREFTWNVSVAVELTGDRAPVISSYDQLVTTLSTADRTVEAVVTDDNPSGGAAGVASVKIMYSTDEGANWNEVAMTGSEPNFSGVIPGQSPGTDVYYYLVAEDVGGLTASTSQVFYSIFLPQNPALLVYDDNAFGIGTILAYWMRNLPPDTTGSWKEWGYDVWLDTYGPISTELLENYQQVYHVMGVGPTNQAGNPYPGNVYKAWFDQASAETPRNLMLAGQDYGFISGFADTTFPAGTFERDILGIETLGPQDLNYSAAGDEQLPYAVQAVQGDPLTGWIADLATDTTFLAYDPYFELGFANWIDNFTVDGATAIMTDPATDGIVAARNEGDNWHATFWSLDPVGLAYESNADSSEVIWIAGVENPAVPVFGWFGAPVVGIEEISNGKTPQTFALKQNYPNPFNPTTKIEFTVPAAQKVTLKVFDITGREVASLVNGNVTAGSYSVEFDASNLASGLYVYSIEAGSFKSSKKMLLVK
ncbi:MAG: T9SS type A sorting domain-containing protein [Calditrichae bacterium]|nr:T9SS type A sorting domain-containing protein [Calditrichia bacterium]